MQTLFVSNMIDYEVSSYGKYTFPVWASIIGWLLASLSVSAIPIYAFYKLYTYPHGTLREVGFFCVKVEQSDNDTILSFITEMANHDTAIAKMVSKLQLTL